MVTIALFTLARYEWRRARIAILLIHHRFKAFGSRIGEASQALQSSQGLLVPILAALQRTSQLN